MKLTFDPIPQDTIEAFKAGDGRELSAPARIWRHFLGRHRDDSRMAIRVARGWVMAVTALLLSMPPSIYLMVRISPWFGFYLVVAGYFLYAFIRPLMRPPVEQRVRDAFIADPERSLTTTIETSDEGLMIARAQRRLNVSWSIVQTFRDAPNLLVLLDDELTPYIVPKRAFTSDEQRAEFERIVRQRAALKGER